MDKWAGLLIDVSYSKLSRSKGELSPMPKLVVGDWEHSSALKSPLTPTEEVSGDALLRTQDSVPSLDEHVTVGRSRDSPTPNGSRDLLCKQSPDRSRDQVTLPVQTRSRGNAHHVYNTKIGKQPSLAKDKTWEDPHGRSTDPTVVGRSPWSIILLHKKYHNAL